MAGSHLVSTLHPFYQVRWRSTPPVVWVGRGTLLLDDLAFAAASSFGW